MNYTFALLNPKTLYAIWIGSHNQSYLYLIDCKPNIAVYFSHMAKIFVQGENIYKLFKYVVSCKVVSCTRHIYGHILNAFLIAHLLKLSGINVSLKSISITSTMFCLL